MSRIEIEGVEYVPLQAVLQEIGVSRQTLWRWRKGEHVPVGRRFRDGGVVFTPEEFEEIRRYANHLEPIATAEDRDQISLFPKGRQHR